MSNIDKHAVQAVADLKAGYTLGHADVAILNELARIALASLEVEPVAYMYKDNLHADARFSLHTRFGNWSQEDINEYEITEIPLYTAPPAPVSVPDDYFSSLVAAARVRADKAMRKFPQPNYVLNKVAEESGEVIKAVIHFTEGREEWRNVEGEIIDNLAMLIRLVMEGDQVIGFTPPDACRAAMLQGAENAEMPTTMQTAPALDSSPKIAESPTGINQGKSEPVTTANKLPEGWVACSERMPEADGNYWGWWSESKRQGPAWFIKSELQAQFQSSEITHWMPLPAAPQQGDSF